MSTSAEQTFYAAVMKAEGVRQVAKAAAFTTWAFGTGGTLTTYITALEAADNAYLTSVNSAQSTAGGIGNSVPNAGSASQVGLVTLGGVGTGGGVSPGLASASATYGSVA
jgi:hypothetical protein